MSHVLVVMTPARSCDSLVDQALGTASQLTLVWLMDEDRRDHLRDCLESRGFVGAGPARDVARLMQETATDEGRRQLEEARLRAEGAGIPVATEVQFGHLEDAVMELYERHRPDRIYLAVGGLGPLVRLFGERAVKRLRRRLGDILITVDAS